MQRRHLKSYFAKPTSKVKLVNIKDLPKLKTNVLYILRLSVQSALEAVMPSTYILGDPEVSANLYCNLRTSVTYGTPSTQIFLPTYGRTEGHADLEKQLCCLNDKMIKYHVHRKSCSFLYSELLYKNGREFLKVKYQNKKNVE